MEIGYKMGKLDKEVTKIDWKRDRTVLCIFDNGSLKRQLESWARDNGYRLVWGRPNTPDIIAFPSVVIIVDRNYLGMDAYESYLDYARGCSEPFDLSSLSEEESKDAELIEALTSKDDTVCIIIDGLRDIEHPMLDNVFQVDPEHDKAFERIITIIKSSDQLY